MPVSVEIPRHNLLRSYTHRDARRLRKGKVSIALKHGDRAAPEIATATSIRWSPFKSTTATSPAVPTPTAPDSRTFPSPFPAAVATNPAPATARSGIPSPFKSPTAARPTPRSCRFLRQGTKFHRRLPGETYSPLNVPHPVSCGNQVGYPIPIQVRRDDLGNEERRAVGEPLSSCP